jgi:hypothetical protein
LLKRAKGHDLAGGGALAAHALNLEPDLLPLAVCAPVRLVVVPAAARELCQLRLRRRVRSPCRLERCLVLQVKARRRYIFKCILKVEELQGFAAEEVV